MKVQRRDLILASGGLAIAAAAAEPFAGALAAGADERYFFSSRNPIANRDQRDLEALAIRLMARPDTQAAIKRTATSWARVSDRSVSREQWSMFDNFIKGYCFRSILMAVNSDANFPRILRVYSPAAKWLGNDVPSSKWGSENPDNAYRIIPIRYDGQYVLHGKQPPNPPSNISYVLVSDTDTSITEGMIEQQNMAIANDGSFTLTIDATPGNGRRNHLQATPDTLYLFIRDSMGDWRQTPNMLRVERVNPPLRGPLTVEELVARASRVMRTGVPASLYWMRSLSNDLVQTMEQPSLTGPSGGLLTQLSSNGSFKLEDDEAAIITTNALDAAYHSIVLYDLWMRSLEYRDRQTSLNNTTMIPDGDGRYTFAITRQDPGIHNWLDTTGLHELSVCMRWQGLIAGNVKAPAIEARVVKASGLENALPPAVQRITQERRAAQLLERQRLYDRRFIET